MKKCPFCAEEIQDEAIVCKHCGRDVVTAPSPPAAPWETEARALIRSGKVVHAIKRIRDETNLSLPDAKGLAERWQREESPTAAAAQAPQVGHASPQAQQKKRTGPVAAGCAAILGLLFVGWCVSQTTRPGTSRAVSPPPPPTTVTKEQAETHARNLEAVRRQTILAGLADAKKVVADPKECDTPKSIADTWTKLRVVKKADPEWREATVLVPKLEACRKKVERSLSKGLQAIMVGQRQEWAKHAEKAMLDQGMDVGFTLSGDKKDRLTVKWALMGKVAVHKITNGGSMSDGSFLSQMQKVGFRRVTFSDGYDFGRYYALEPSDEATGGNTVLAGLGIGTPLKLH